MFASGHREATVGLGVILVTVAFAWLGPQIWRADPLAVNLANSLLPPSAARPFGTDDVGRDVLARVMSAGQLDIIAAAAVTAVGGLLGMSVGLLAGLRGGLTDNASMRLIDSLLAFPPLILALAISVALGAGTVSAALGITISTVPFYARLMRSEVLRVQALPFVEAAVASGCQPSRIVWRHILPHTWQVMTIQASSVVGYAVLTLAALGFVGLGVQVPTPEWGTMITAGLSYVLSGQWWIGVFPGAMLLILVIGCNLVADGLGGEAVGSVLTGSTRNLPE
jgi:peptide/nickel transport system permease protein